MDSNTSSGAGERPVPPPRPATGQRAKRSRRPVFDKEHATLWLLTLSLGLGVGAIVRFAERSNHAATVAQVGQLAVQQAASPAYGSPGSVPYQSQRVSVLPQRSFAARGTTRMS